MPVEQIVAIVESLFSSSFYNLAGTCVRDDCRSLATTLLRHGGLPWHQVMSCLVPGAPALVITNATLTRVEERGAASSSTLATALFRRIVLISIICVTHQKHCTRLVAQPVRVLTMGHIDRLRIALNAAGVCVSDSAASGQADTHRENGYYVVKLLARLWAALGHPFACLLDNADWLKPY